MTIDALLLGSIGVIAETSHLQRQAFNDAFAAAGLPWQWSEPEYRELLKTSGGKARVADFAARQGVEVDAEAIHADKVARFGRLLADQGLSLRPGIREVIDAAQNRGMPVLWATDTGEAQSRAILDALGNDLRIDDFALVGSDMLVENRKPAPDIYRTLLRMLQVDPENAVAVEDTGVCARAAVDAGIRTFATPNAMADASDFGPEVTVLETLTPAILDTVPPQAAVA